ncbi:MAG: TetR/AcrR family transcriptional regulator [Ideonella sp.]|nr:TetR/AcrR family transcriptional regulator [Ideonella sp.]
MVATRTASPRSPSRTRERILDASLALFNESGAPNITTNHIADAAGISPGNLYYHFRHKEDIVMALYGRYETALNGVLDSGQDAQDAVSDLWLLVHLAFEVIQDFRFIHRDLSDLSAAYPALRARFQRSVEAGIARTSAYCLALARAGALDASPEEAHALATNISLVTTYWLNLQALRHASRGGLAPPDDDTISEGVFQVLSLITPYLRGAMREDFRRIALRYLPPPSDRGDCSKPTA